MNVQTVNGIVSRANGLFETVKDFVLWGGHKIQLGFTNYVVPTIKSLWSCTLNSVRTCVNFLKTGPGLALVGAAGLFAFGVAALRISNQKDYDEQEHILSQTAWKALGAVSITAAVAGVGLAFIAL